MKRPRDHVPFVSDAPLFTLRQEKVSVIWSAQENVAYCIRLSQFLPHKKTKHPVSVNMKRPNEPGDQMSTTHTMLAVEPHHLDSVLRAPANMSHQQMLSPQAEVITEGSTVNTSRIFEHNKTKKMTASAQGVLGSGAIVQPSSPQTEIASLRPLSKSQGAEVSAVILTQGASPKRQDKLGQSSKEVEDPVSSEYIEGVLGSGAIVPPSSPQTATASLRPLSKSQGAEVSAVILTQGTPPKRQDKPHYHGHRQRLKERFLQSPQSLPDYELLELFLFWVYPRQDVKPLAKTLLQQHKTLSHVVHQGVGATRVLFAAVQEMARRLLLTEVSERPVLHNAQKVIAYCHLTMAHLSAEHFRLFFLDKKYGLLDEEVHQGGTLDQVALYPREVAKRVLAVNAACLILVHNHPSGDPSPSQADIQLTRHLRQALMPFAVQVLDHFIIGKQGYFSFREHGLMEVMS